MRLFTLTVLLFFVGNQSTFAQSQMRVVGSGEIAAGTIVANDARNKDANGRLAAVLTIETDLTGLSFEVDAVRTENKPGQYMLFLSPGERKVRVLSASHLPLDIILSEFGIRLKSGEAWRLKLTGDKKIEAIPVNLISVPADAKKIIDGKDEGTGSVFQLGLGKHKIRLEKEGFGPLEQEIEVSTAKSLFNFTLKEVELQPVTLRSEPAGATVFLDGIQKGLTPKGLFQYPGRYTVKWSLSGYVDAEQQIDVYEGGKNEFSVRLEKNTGLLSWSVSPSNANVSINKEDFTNKTTAELAPGRYLFELNAAGYDPQSESIELKRGENVRKTYSLVQQTGGLQFSVEPVDAQVELLRGTTPVEKWTGLKIVRNVPVGSYVIRASLAGYKTQEKPVAIAKGQTLTIDVTLEKGASAGQSITNSIGTEFVLIPAGTFQMGSNELDNEKPVHSVSISQPFYMGKYEVTQKEWQAVMGSNPSSFEGDNRPVENVSWNDVQEFIKKLNRKEGGNKYRLPTEAEWEYAARAGSTGKWTFGDNESQLGEYAWYSSNSGSETKPVGQKKANAFGLYDVHGNVWEWCQDWYDSSYYQNSPSIDPTGASSGSSRVLRGGSWFNAATYTRAAFRFNINPGYRINSLGFRLLRLQ